MIYIFAGSDTKKINAGAKTIYKDVPIFISTSEVSQGMLESYAMSTSLFGESPVLVLDNALSESEIVLSSKDLANLQESKTIFIFREDKMLAAAEKKYSKYAIIERFDNKKLPAPEPNNIFLLADAFAQKDKVKTWMLYRDVIDKGGSPEANKIIR